MQVYATSLSGMHAQKQRLAASAANIANVATAGHAPGTGGTPAVYLPLRTQFVATDGGGVRAHVTEDAAGYAMIFDPSSQAADADGMVAVPQVDLAAEAVNLSIAKNLFKANAAVLKTQDEMMGALLDIDT